MRNVILAFLLFSFVGLSLKAQQDTIVRFNTNFKFKDGLYLSFEDFKANCPSIKAKSLRNQKGELLSDNWSRNKKLYYQDNDSLREIGIGDTWGFSENGRAYIVKQNKYKRLQIIGSICHVVLVEEIEEFADGYGRNSFYARPIVREVSNEYIIDFERGVMELFEKEFFESILERDYTLFKEYKSLKGKKEKKGRMFHFLTRYNNAHPIYFSVSQCQSWLELGNISSTQDPR